MTVIGKKQVWLAKKLCRAVLKEQEHEGHVYHYSRRFGDSNSTIFYSYFYCEGFTFGTSGIKSIKARTVGDLVNSYRKI